jgi:hypothetical protein
LILNEVQPAADQGAPEGNQNATKNKEENKPDDISFVSPKKYGTGRTYTFRRLKRDRQDLCASRRRWRWRSQLPAGPTGFEPGRSASSRGGLASLHHRGIDDGSNFLDWTIDVDRVIVGKLYDSVIRGGMCLVIARTRLGLTYFGSERGASKRQSFGIASSLV